MRGDPDWTLIGVPGAAEPLASQQRTLVTELASQPTQRTQSYECMHDQNDAHDNCLDRTVLYERCFQ